MAMNDAAADELDPRRLHIPMPDELPKGGLRFVYDRRADMLLVDFYGHPEPAISVPIDAGDRDFLYLRVDPETRRVVGLQIEAFLAYAVHQDPIFIEALAIADLRDYSDLEATKLRRLAAAALQQHEWSETAFLADISRRIA